MNVFIDTSIYLTFYHLSNEDLEELRKVFVLQKSSKISIWLPNQVVDEFNRNRETKIADALKRFKEEKLNNQIPQMVKEYPDYNELIRSMRVFDKAKNAILDHIKKDIAEKSLKADEIIQDIFAKANRVPIDPSLLEVARIRYDRGNPPGKRDSYGDAINWEALLMAIPQGEDIHIIADDSDYYSLLNPDELNDFLRSEWRSRKWSLAWIYKRLSQFLAKNFPTAKLASELEKDILIKELAESLTFARTHKVIAGLLTCGEFSIPQVNDLVNACLTNTQVNWIIGDEDVMNFVQALIRRYADFIDKDNLQLLNFLIDKAKEDQSPA
jgi:PIN domain